MKSTTITTTPVNPSKRKIEERPINTKVPRVELSKDTWVFKGKEYRMVEGAIPNAIASAFEKPTTPAKPTEPYEYDRSKLSVYCMSSVEGPDLAARVELLKGPSFIADVIPDKESFRIQVYPSKQGLFPLTSAEFLKAVYAAKLNIFLKTDEEDSEQE
jgi:hypothetical protein